MYSLSETFSHIPVIPEMSLWPLASQFLLRQSDVPVLAPHSWCSWGANHLAHDVPYTCSLTSTFSFHPIDLVALNSSGRMFLSACFNVLDASNGSPSALMFLEATVCLTSLMFSLMFLCSHLSDLVEEHHNGTFKILSLTCLSTHGVGRALGTFAFNSMTLSTSEMFQHQHLSHKLRGGKNYSLIFGGHILVIQSETFPQVFTLACYLGNVQSSPRFWRPSPGLFLLMPSSSSIAGTFLQFSPQGGSPTKIFLNILNDLTPSYNGAKFEAQTAPL